MANSDINQNETKICIIGAGFSGICAGVKLKTDLNLENFIIFEENSEVGGTWLTNTYPGCACDIPSHLYSFSFELNPGWTTQYAKQPEILTYLKNVASKYELYSHIKFNSQIKTTAWDGKVKKWIVTVYEKYSKNMVEHCFDFVISGVGVLREPNIPEEFLAFKGPVMHSARWDANIDLDNKVVAIIGSGCSAVQIIPEITQQVEKLLCFQRNPAWVIPQLQSQFSEVTKRGFAVIPGFQRLYRSMIFFSHEMSFPAFKTNSLFSKVATWMGKRHLKSQIPDDLELRNKLTPDYQFGCKRASPSNHYYKTLAMPQNSIIRDRIVSVTEGSIVTEGGQEFKIDILVLATGYKVQDFWSPMNITGRCSENILDSWKKLGPIHYLGIMTSTAPNLFFLYGPNTGVGHNTVVVTIECQMNWIVQVIREMIKRKSQVVSVSEAVEQKYMKNLMNKMTQTVYGSSLCTSWYVDKDGINTHIYPGSVISYWNKTRKLQPSKLEFI